MIEIKVGLRSFALISSGQFTYVTEKNTNNSMNPRVFPGIALAPTGFMGGDLFINLENMETVVTHQFTINKMPAE